jgi:hypothetical protein
MQNHLVEAPRCCRFSGRQHSFFEPAKSLLKHPHSIVPHTSKPRRATAAADHFFDAVALRGSEVVDEKRNVIMAVSQRGTSIGKMFKR